MSEPKRLDIGGGSVSRPSRCSGALLVVNRESYRELERSGVRWATRSDEIPYDRKVSARVSCDGEEMTMERSTGRVTYGLCSSCAHMEAEQRRHLRERAGMRGAA